MRKIREWSKCCKEKVMTNVRFERVIALFPSGHNLENPPTFPGRSTVRIEFELEK
jgi:hypothetical protein